MSLKADEKDDAASDFWTASKSYKKSAPECEPRSRLSLWRALTEPQTDYPAPVFSGRCCASKDDPAVSRKGQIQASGRPGKRDCGHLAARRWRLARRARGVRTRRGLVLCRGCSGVSAGVEISISPGKVITPVLIDFRPAGPQIRATRKQQKLPPPCNSTREPSSTLRRSQQQVSTRR